MSDILHTSPQETWNALASQPNSVLVDVRTSAEWAFIGLPDLSALGKKAILVEWNRFPTMEHNVGFAEELLDQLDGQMPNAIYFLCRSGVRSLAAAQLMTEVFLGTGDDVMCVNIAEGFEGDLDSQRHRGNINGWKFRGLDWIQS